MYTRVEIPVGEKLMPALVFRPGDETARAPGLIIAQHLPVAHAGLELDPFQIDAGERYAHAGFVCVMPFLFHHWPTDIAVEAKREQFRDDWTVADLQAAQEWLRTDEQVDGERLGVVGHCWGGRIAWLAACHLEHLSAAAVFYGGRVRIPFADAGPAPLTLANQIKCPVLGVFGNNDASPSREDVDVYEKALADAGVRHQFLRYDGAGHGFQDFTNEERFCEAASEDAWRKALAFFIAELSLSC
jgi:carboxymethylenebutenolidase